MFQHTTEVRIALPRIVFSLGALAASGLINSVVVATVEIHPLSFALPC